MSTKFAQRNNATRAQLVTVRYLPGFPAQGDGARVSRQAVEIRTVQAGKCFQLVQDAKLFKDFRVQLKRCMR